MQQTEVWGSGKKMSKDALKFTQNMAPQHYHKVYYVVNLQLFKIIY